MSSGPTRHRVPSCAAPHALLGAPPARSKRVNVGLEIVAMPDVLFLDEPTSGLDGSSAFELAKSLRFLADRGMLVIAVIHQPRYTVFQQFTHVLLLSAGRLVKACRLPCWTTPPHRPACCLVGA